MTSAPSAQNNTEPSTSRLNVAEIRGDFPAIHQEIAPGVPLVYLDSAASALKPWSVIRAVQAFDAEHPANVHRGLHTLSERATEAFEGARSKIARFLGADDEEIVFTRGTTESINLVARTWAADNLKPGDEILVTLLEHHSNLVPWQMLAKERGLVLKFVPILDDGRLDVDAFADLLGEKTRLVAITAMSNVLGTIPPVADLIAMARKRGAVVVLDAAQSVAHGPTRVRDLDADFVAFSGHKMYGPTGIGVLYGRRALLEAMPPMFGGGSMVTRVTLQGAEWNDVPWKFEGGTPPIAQAIGLGAAVDYLTGIGLDAIQAHEQALLAYAHQRLAQVEGARILGPAPEHKGAILPLEVQDVHPHDLAQLLDRHGVAVRAGHHCAMPLHDRLGLMATARASLAVYNTPEEIDRLAMAIEDARRVMTRRQPARRENSR